MPGLELKNKALKSGKCLAVFGTGSDVGKSIVTTALCRFFVKQEISTAPFKAQNMSNNSGVTPDGLEMGRAQIVQAEAAGIAPHVYMNPILLKPTSDTGAQVVVLGNVLEDSSAMEYHSKKNEFFSQACSALDSLREKYELVVIEGAGSCAEVNLMPNDIVNLRMAEYAGAPVILVADIHKGGVFAQIVGTLECLAETQREMIAGFIINRFRGDKSLFSDGISWIEKKTGKKVFGVLPWYDHIRIEAEDSVVIENVKKVAIKGRSQKGIAVIRLPHISNFTDFDPLLSLNGVELFFIEALQELSSFKAVILPGSKNTQFDLKWLHSTGWAKEIKNYADQGGHILGICGGYQMMGRHVHDPDGIEGKPGTTGGLSLLPVETFLKAPKTTTLSCFSWKGIPGTGYEIHMGKTNRLEGDPLFSVSKQNGITCSREDGCSLDASRILGTYMHGLFDSPGITELWLESIGLDNVKTAQAHGLTVRDKEYDLLAAYFEKHIDIKAIKELLKL
ncbi:adenosylcobyric acid synthase [Desulfosarcina sp. BuS5]|nr:adenosylcobyric acid synthase [Desulfosarcina sp. BuS5]